MLVLTALLLVGPLIQRFVPYLGHPAYALSVILFAILRFTGVGSLRTRGRTGASFTGRL